MSKHFQHTGHRQHVQFSTAGKHNLHGQFKQLQRQRAITFPVRSGSPSGAPTVKEGVKRARLEDRPDERQVKPRLEVNDEIEREEALTEALEQRDAKAMIAALQAGPSEMYYTARGRWLRAAASLGSELIPVVEFLLKAGLHPDYVDGFDDLPAIYTACVRGDLEMAKILKNFGADLNYLVRGKPLLRWTSESPLPGPDRDAMLSWLVRNGAQIDVSVNGANDTTPLNVACSLGLVDLVWEFQQQGADLFKVDDQGRTCLMYAARGGWSELVNSLLNAGISAVQTDHEGRTALSYLCEATDEEDEDSPEIAEILRKLVPLLTNSSAALQDVVRCDRGRILERLHRAGADIGVRNGEGQTLLMAASRAAGIVCVRYLLSRHSEVNAVDPVQWTALHHACTNVYADEVVQALLGAHADPMHCDQQGRTALMVAAEVDNPSCLALLLQSGVPVDAVDAAGDNALDLAATRWSPGATEALLRAGTRLSKPIDGRDWEDMNDWVATLLIHPELLADGDLPAPERHALIRNAPAPWLQELRSMTADFRHEQVAVVSSKLALCAATVRKLARLLNLEARFLTSFTSPGAASGTGPGADVGTAAPNAEIHETQWQYAFAISVLKHSDAIHIFPQIFSAELKSRLEQMSRRDWDLLEALATQVLDRLGAKLKTGIAQTVLKSIDVEGKQHGKRLARNLAREFGLARPMMDFLQSLIVTVLHRLKSSEPAPAMPRTPSRTQLHVPLGANTDRLIPELVKEMDAWNERHRKRDLRNQAWTGVDPEKVNLVFEYCLHAQWSDICDGLGANRQLADLQAEAEIDEVDEESADSDVGEDDSHSASGEADSA